MSGKRCAIAMWFTHQKKYKELERSLAEQLINKIDKGEL